jgi:hypothetical protein
MHSEITVKYTNSNTLKALKALSKFLDFTISKPSADKKKETYTYINGVPIVPGDYSIDISGMGDIISRNKMDANKLRKQAWQRNK